LWTSRNPLGQPRPRPASCSWAHSRLPHPSSYRACISRPPAPVRSCTHDCALCSAPTGNGCWRRWSARSSPFTAAWASATSRPTRVRTRVHLVLPRLPLPLLARPAPLPTFPVAVCSTPALAVPSAHAPPSYPASVIRLHDPTSPPHGPPPPPPRCKSPTPTPTSCAPFNVCNERALNAFLAGVIQSSLLFSSAIVSSQPVGPPPRPKCAPLSLPPLYSSTPPSPEPSPSSFCQA
jgi:hypothetical protein